MDCCSSCPNKTIMIEKYEGYSNEDCLKLNSQLKVDNPLILERCYSSRLIGKKKSLVLHGGGNVSVKIKALTIFNEEKEWLAVKGSGYDLGNLVPKGLPFVDLQYLRKLTELHELSDELMVNEFRTHLKDAHSPTPSVESLLHALIPATFVDHSHADAIVALADQDFDVSKQLFRRAFEGIPELNPFCIVPYVMPGFELAVVCKQVLKENPDAKLMILLKHGLFTWGETARESYNLHIAAVSACERFIVARQEQNPIRLTPNREDGIKQASTSFSNRVLNNLRGLFNEMDPQKAGWIVAKSKSTLGEDFANSKEATKLGMIGPCTPDHVIRTRMIPLIISEFVEEQFQENKDDLTARLRFEMDQYRRRYMDYFTKYNLARPEKDQIKVPLDPLPRVILVEGIGLITAGRTYQDAMIAADIYERTISTILSSYCLTEAYNPANEKEIFDVEYWSLEQAKLKSPTTALPLAGRICFITGGASGIGLECARLFHKKGACIFIVDSNQERIDIAVETLGKGVKAMTIDVTIQDSIQLAFNQCTAEFGGVDVVISNAGKFVSAGPSYGPSQEPWNESLELNFRAHQYVSAAAVPILKEQCLGGCILFNVSKAPLNPGPLQGHYAIAKAATGALMRQLAVECAEFGIRSNAVNADRVRTNLFDEVLVSQRAAARGLTVDAYFQSNLLKKEVTVKDVAEAFLFLACAEKTTGTYVCVDGGCIQNAPR